MIRWIIYKARSFEARGRGWIVRAYIILMGGQCGKHLRVGRRCTFKHPPHPGMEFGNSVIIGNDVTFDIEPTAKLVVGSRVKVTGYCFIAASGSIVIGDDTLVAEFVSIRDSNHEIKADELISAQPLVVGSVTIGADVWIGRGVAIIKGASIGRGAVIGANSVVRSQISELEIAVGVPARPARLRVR